MYLIEPCCARRHLLNLRNAIKNGGTADFEGYEDMSLAELLPPMLTRYSEVEMMIVAPSLPDQAAEAVASCMRQQWARADGNGKLNAVARLTVVADLRAEKSPLASTWKKKNPFGGRLTLVDMRQDSTAILLPDFAVTGPVNMRYGRRFTATATTSRDFLDRLWHKYRTMAERQPEPEKDPEPEKKARKRKAAAKPKQKK